MKLLHLFLIPLQMSTNVAAKDGVSGSLFGHREELLSTTAGDVPGQHAGYQGRLRSLPCLSWQDSSPEVSVDRWIEKSVNVPGTQSSRHISVSSTLRFPHLQSSPSTVFLSSATSTPWPQERGLGEVCAALGSLWCQMSVKRCS